MPLVWYSKYIPMHHTCQNLAHAAGLLANISMGLVPKKTNLFFMYGAIYIFCDILKHFVVSAAEAKHGALFINCKKGKMVCLVFEELGHK